MKKIVYNLEFLIETALHIGSGILSPETGAGIIAQNGAGEYYIPGTSFAGLFFERLWHLNNENEDDVYNTLMGKVEMENSNENKKYYNTGSPIVFRSSIIEKPELMIRDRVKINRKLRTAEYESKFSVWQINPHIHKEPLIIKAICEIDLSSFIIDDMRQASNINKKIDYNIVITTVEKVFNSWNKEGLFIGGYSSSGMGWATLKSATKNSESVLRDDIKKDLHSVFKTWDVILEVKNESDGYGTNGLLIRGGDEQLSFRYNEGKTNINQSPISEINPQIDAVFMHDGKQLFIPGSSLKGAISFYLDKYGKTERLKNLLGQEKSDVGGKVFFKDLYPTNYKSKHLLTIERHAEDEFTRAILGTSKFDEECLFNTTFEGQIRCYANDEKEVGNMIAFIKDLCDNRMISIGAGSCYPKITIKEKEN